MFYQLWHHKIEQKSMHQQRFGCRILNPIQNKTNNSLKDKFKKCRFLSDSNIPTFRSNHIIVELFCLLLRCSYCYKCELRCIHMHSPLFSVQKGCIPQAQSASRGETLLEFHNFAIEGDWDMLSRNPQKAITQSILTSLSLLIAIDCTKKTNNCQTIWNKTTLSCNNRNKKSSSSANKRGLRDRGKSARGSL